MEGQSEQENLLQLMSLNIGGNCSGLSYGPEDYPNQQSLMEARRISSQPNALPLHPWTNFPKAPRSYVEFLADNSTFLENATGADMLETITSPICSTQSDFCVFQTQRELLINNLGKACDYELADSFLSMDALKVRFQNPPNEVESAHRFTSFQQQILAQHNHTLLTQEPYEDNCNVSQLQPRVTKTSSFRQSKGRSSGSRQRASAVDRERRVRISERIRALQEQLPNSVEGSQATVMEDTIDYIKFLQLQLKELTRSRLGGQSASPPFVFLEMTNEPLEEMMGKLLEGNPSAASQLLESRGLYMMPMSLVEDLHQSS
ncbi:transcription factor bHLH7-like isoform X2 [Mangifera indica]|uniref:transcription factor bHLH7-like isoform X2 n=1 Tax=Mangifera indica TaxID=29780 RepID=UPI001CFAB5FF|nr:transcription factor bHLH7-like isoform X2 [Mangifera indica]